MKQRLRLDVVVRDGAAVLEAPAREDQAIVGKNALLVLLVLDAQNHLLSAKKCQIIMLVRIMNIYQFQC